MTLSNEIVAGRGSSTPDCITVDQDTDVIKGRYRNEWALIRVLAGEPEAATPEGLFHGSTMHDNTNKIMLLKLNFQ